MAQNRSGQRNLRQVSDYRKPGRPATNKDKNGRPIPVRADRDRPVQGFFEAVPRRALENALMTSGYSKFSRLYDALQDPAYSSTNPSTLCRRFKVSLMDLVSLWFDYHRYLAMFKIAERLPEFAEQLVEDALNGDKRAREWVLEIAGLTGRNKAPIVAIQQNFGAAGLEETVTEVGKILLERAPCRSEG